jgi:rubredoxin
MPSEVDMHKCPCCGYLTLSEEPPGTFEICPVCNWEDDSVQFADPTFEGGANQVSLERARDNFASYGASSPDALKLVRKPHSEEIPA